MSTEAFRAAEFNDSGNVERRGEGEALRALGRTLMGRKLLILGLFLLFSAIAGAVAWFMPARYKSSATVLVQPVGNPADRTAMNMQAQPEIVRSQLEIVGSPRVIERVIDNQRLMDDEDYAPSGSLQNGDAETRRAAVVANVTKRLNVENDGRSVTLRISYEASTPQKAERITNDIANEYIRATIEIKNRALKLTKDRLDGRLAELRQSTLQAEQAAEDYRRSANLVWLDPARVNGGAVGGTTYSSRLLEQFSGQAAALLATSTQATAKALGSNADVARTGGAVTPEVLSSTLVTSLMQRDAELAETEAAMAARYTRRHVPLVQVRAKRAKLRASLAAAKAGIHSSLVLEASIARTAQEAATVRANALQNLVNQQIADGARYRQLQNDATIKRKAYEEFADQATILAERSLLQLPDAVLIYPASLPVKASWPNRYVIFGLGCVVALVLATAIAVLLAFLSPPRRYRR